MNKKVKILELCTRDGMHALRHKLTAPEMAEICKELDSVGVDSIEFGHGNGLAGSSFQYGFAAATDLEYIEAVSKVVTKTQLSIIIIPGILPGMVPFAIGIIIPGMAPPEVALS